MNRATRYEDSEDEPLVPRRSTRSRSRNNSDNEQRRHTRSQAASTTHIKKRGRKRSVESEGDSSYHDPTSEEDGDAFRDSALQLSETEEDIIATQELTSQGELLPVEQPTPPTQDVVNGSRPSQDEPPQDQAQRPSSASTQGQASSQDPSAEAQPSPRQDPPAEQPASPREDPHVEQRSSPREHPQAEQQASPCQDPQRESPRESNQRRQDSAGQTRTADGIQRSDSPTRQSSRKYRRVQNKLSNGHTSSSSSSSLFRSLNPYDRPGKPWGEFVVEVLLAERTARNEDELDYVQFVRGLYEI